MKHIILLSIFIGVIWACDTKQEIIDTGISNPYFEGSIMEYLRSHKKNWDYTIQMIEHAGLVGLFEGEDENYPEITFWAPPSYSIQRFILESQKKQEPGKIYLTINDIPEELCREYILMHVVKGKHLKESIHYINKDYFINDEKQDGGTDFTCLSGNILRAYLQTSSWAGVADVGPVSLGLYSVTKGQEIRVATPDIQPKNGVVHALHYSYDFGKMCSE